MIFVSYAYFAIPRIMILKEKYAQPFHYCNSSIYSFLKLPELYYWALDKQCVGANEIPVIRFLECLFLSGWFSSGSFGQKHVTSCLSKQPSISKLRLKVTWEMDLSSYLLPKGHLLHIGLIKLVICIFLDVLDHEQWPSELAGEKTQIPGSMLQ